VQTDPLTVAPEDVAIIETAGGRVAEGEPIPQSALDAVLRPRRPAGRGGRPGGRGGSGPRGGQGGRGGYGGRGGRDGGDRHGGRPRRDPDAPAGDGRRDWSPR
ncbi:MAG TPA: hypothetical protein VLO09_06320, partial [Ornithinimicrobium sp.]|nr:hypothetical protein [Ornithinimicrobium sp.]